MLIKEVVVDRHNHIPILRTIGYCTSFSDHIYEIRAVLIEQLFFSRFSSFIFQEKQDKKEKQETFQSLEN